VSGYLIYFDLETGGVEPQHPVIQVAAIAVDGTGAEVAAFNARVAFDESAADPEALRLNHYSKDAWTGAKSPARVAEDFASWLRPFSSVSLVSKRTGRPYSVARLAGYNAVAFDFPRLKAMFGERFMPCEYLVRDVLQRVLFYFDDNPTVKRPENFKLSTVCEYFGIAVDGAHDALVDVRLTAQLHRALVAREVEAA
jgi:DNA polymerase III epsilon subunit-like protein